MVRGGLGQQWLKKLEEQGDDYAEARAFPSSILTSLSLTRSQWKDGREQRLLDYIKGLPNFEDLERNPPAILNAIDTFANNEDFLISVGPDKASKIAQIVQDRRPQVIVELGGYLGYSAILLANELRNISNTLGEESGCRVWSLEFEPGFAKIARELIEIAGLSSLVTVMTGSAEESLRDLKASAELERIDLLFLDHVEDLYKQDLQVCEELGMIKSGSTLIADNVVRPGAPQYREYVRGVAEYCSYGLESLIMPGDFEVGSDILVMEVKTDALCRMRWRSALACESTWHLRWRGCGYVRIIAC